VPGSPAFAIANEGAMVQMISHGFISAAMFLVVGVLYDRLHSREISTYGGVINSVVVANTAYQIFACTAPKITINSPTKPEVPGSPAFAIDGREFSILAILALAVLVVGLYPQPMIEVMHTSIEHLLNQALTSKL
jgi:NADH-quinone oxidoreductase subunit M